TRKVSSCRDSRPRLAGICNDRGPLSSVHWKGSARRLRYVGEGRGVPRPSSTLPFYPRRAAPVASYESPTIPLISECQASGESRIEAKPPSENVGTQLQLRPASGHPRSEPRPRNDTVEACAPDKPTKVSRPSNAGC